MSEGVYYGTGYFDSIRLCFKNVMLAANGSTPPLRAHLYQNFPNPFKPPTRIRFDLRYDGIVMICIFEALGREVEVLADHYL